MHVGTQLLGVPLPEAGVAQADGSEGHEDRGDPEGQEDTAPSQADDRCEQTHQRGCERLTKRADRGVGRQRPHPRGRMVVIDDERRVQGND